MFSFFSQVSVSLLPPTGSLPDYTGSDIPSGHTQPLGLPSQPILGGHSPGTGLPPCTGLCDPGGQGRGPSVSHHQVPGTAWPEHVLDTKCHPRSVGPSSGRQWSYSVLWKHSPPLDTGPQHLLVPWPRKQMLETGTF